MTLATFDYLALLEWLPQHRNLALVGPPGTGKAHLADGLGYAAVDADYRVRFFRADALVEQLYRGLADNSVGRVIDNILRADLVIVDKLGFSPLDPVAANHLFRLVAAAYETRSLVLTSNWPFEQWTNFLPDAATATAILDRLLHHCQVVVLSGELLPPTRGEGGGAHRPLRVENFAVAKRGIFVTLDKDVGEALRTAPWVLTSITMGM